MGAGQVDADLVFLRGGPVVWPLPALDARAEAESLAEAGVALGTALTSGELEAFPRTPTGPAACTELGCGYVARCWGRMS